MPRALRRESEAAACSSPTQSPGVMSVIDGTPLRDRTPLEGVPLEGGPGAMGSSVAAPDIAGAGAGAAVAATAHNVAVEAVEIPVSDVPLHPVCKPRLLLRPKSMSAGSKDETVAIGGGRAPRGEAMWLLFTAHERASGEVRRGGAPRHGWCCSVRRRRLPSALAPRGDGCAWEGLLLLLRLASASSSSDGLREPGDETTGGGSTVAAAAHAAVSANEEQGVCMVVPKFCERSLRQFVNFGHARNPPAQRVPSVGPQPAPQRRGHENLS